MYMAKKRRTQLYLDTRQKRVLRTYSRITGKSMGQLVREAVDKAYLKSEPAEEPIFTKDNPLWKIAGQGRSKERDISTRHDYYLYLAEKE
jgi:hypothetical protein